jgi:hypothetical protein
MSCEPLFFKSTRRVIGAESGANLFAGIIDISGGRALGKSARPSDIAGVAIKPYNAK